ncbi:hypothetical protein DIE21_33795 [Burkholderia sp. Bp9140]|nr:hypothetical protein DIE21_33795 [Burkholderia sp. Bp9140]
MVSRRAAIDDMRRQIHSFEQDISGSLYKNAQIVGLFRLGVSDIQRYLAAFGIDVDLTRDPSALAKINGGKRSLLDTCAIKRRQDDFPVLQQDEKTPPISIECDNRLGCGSHGRRQELEFKSHGSVTAELR